MVLSFITYLFLVIYLASPGLSCSMQDLPSSLRHAGSLVAACGIWFPDQGSNPDALGWGHRALATREVPVIVLSLGGCREDPLKQILSGEIPLPPPPPQFPHLSNNKVPSSQLSCPPCRLLRESATLGNPYRAGSTWTVSTGQGTKSVCERQRLGPTRWGPRGPSRRYSLMGSRWSRSRGSTASWQGA